MVLADPDGRHARTACPAPARRPSVDACRWVSVSIAVVAILAGSALFISGYTLGSRTAADPGTPVVGRGGIPAVLGHLPRDRGPLRGRRRRQDTPDPGRHPRDDRLPGRPVFGLPVVRGIPPEPAWASAGSSRGSAPRSRRGRIDGDGRLRAARSVLPAGGDTAAPRITGRDRSASRRATSSPRSTGRPSTG